LLQKTLKNTEIDNVIQQSAQELAISMQAEICFLFTLTDDSRSIEIHGKIDRRSKEQNVDRPPDQQTEVGIELTGSNFPLLVNSIQLNRPLRLPASSNSPDMVNLIQFFQLDAAGHLLLIPAIAEGLPSLGIALLSPLSKKSWSQVDVQKVRELIQPVARFLQQSVQVKRMECRLKRLESEYRATSSHDTQTQAQEELSLLRKVDLDKQAQIQTLAALISLQQESLTKTSQKIQGLQAELANQKDGLSRQEVEVVLLQTQELRQPLTTIQEYSNFLLSESMGVLSAIQRKFIDGIRHSGERVNQISRDLEENLRVHSSLTQSEWVESDLGEILDNSVNRSSSLLRSKRILLKMDLPELLPTLMTDRQALSQVMDSLVLRAAKVTPSQGQVSLAALVEENNGKPEYVIVQIRDSSGGLTNSSLQDGLDNDHQSQLFGTDGLRIESDSWNGQGNELSIIQNLVENLNGRVWLDNDLGSGTTFNILLPVFTPTQRNSKLVNKGNSS
jgi:signal transduction histidine kinase